MRVKGWIRCCISNNEAKSNNTNDNEEEVEDGNWDVSLPPSKRKKSNNDKPNRPNNDDDVDWIGALGIDALSLTRRTKPSSSICTQCPIFPICHDAALYGRVM